MFKARCPKCNVSSKIVNGICSDCGYDVSEFMKNNGLTIGNRMAYDKMFICPNCGTIDSGEGTIRLKCYECGTPYKATDIDRVEYGGQHTEACINDCLDEFMHNLLEKYVGDTINWDIYYERESKWNETLKKRVEYDRQKQAEEQARQDAINHPKCPKCGSTAIDATNRGYSLLTGFLGSGKTMNYCKNCGYKWKPRK